MSDEAFMELQAEVRGVRQMVTMILITLATSELKHEFEDLPGRIEFTEDEMRKRGEHSGVIEVLRTYRELLGQLP